MTLDPNDPRLTAYALGEIQGPDLAAFEAELSASPETRTDLGAVGRVELVEGEGGQPGVIRVEWHGTVLLHERAWRG